MKAHFKITSTLLSDIQKDLKRPHPFAYERIGFISAGIAAAGENILILARQYKAIVDEDYLDNPDMGAMIGPNAINKALQWALDGNAIFHVHMHECSGKPRYSRIDLEESAKFVPDFFKVAPKLVQGTILLSEDSAIGQVWLKPKDPCLLIDEVSAIGSPIRKWRQS